MEGKLPHRNRVSQSLCRCLRSPNELVSYRNFGRGRVLDAPFLVRF